MPQYTITDPTTQRKVTLTGDSPPTEAELTQIFSSLAPSHPQEPAQRVPAAGRGTSLDVRKSDDFASGMGAGAASTVYHGGDLIRRATGMERVIERPEVQAAITAPDNFQGKAGKAVEQALEFGIPLSKISKATAGASLFTRAAAEGVGGALTAGVQTGGDPTSMLYAGAAGTLLPFAAHAVGAGVQAVRSAAAGAGEGGLGGAVAGAVRGAAPIESRVMMTQALKPRNAATNWGRSVDSAMPDLKAAETALGKPVETIEDLLAAVKAAKSQNRSQFNAMAGPMREAGTTVDLTPVADEVVARIPRKLQLTNPDQAEAIAKGADVYRKRFSLEDVEALLQDTNAQLDAYYAQFPAAQRSALRARPEVAQLVAEADSLRKALYSTLDAPGQGEAARALQQKYGALLDVEHEAVRRVNVAARQQPESLSEQIGNVRAAADAARGVWRLAHMDFSGAADLAAAHAGRVTSKAIKESQTTNALIRRAFRAYQSPSAAPLAPVASHATGAR